MDRVLKIRDPEFFFQFYVEIGMKSWNIDLFSLAPQTCFIFSRYQNLSIVLSICLSVRQSAFHLYFYLSLSHFWVSKNDNIVPAIQWQWRQFLIRLVVLWVGYSFGGSDGLSAVWMLVAGSWFPIYRFLPPFSRCVFSICYFSLY